MAIEVPPRIGIVTGELSPTLTEEGQVLLSELDERGIQAEPVVWSDSEVDWSTFDILLVRSCWEYHQSPTEFRAWLDSVESRVDRLINSPDVIRWNMHKRYLTELAEAGVSTAPTVFIERGSEAKLSAICQREGWSDVVVKPAIGTSSEGIFRANTPVSTETEQQFQTAVTTGDVLVQRFLPEIAGGELSMIFFDGEYSHANRTVPDSNDFRAHHNFGASSVSASPSHSIRRTGRTIIETASDLLSLDPDELVYARIDGIERDGAFILLELELIEPYLNLSLDDGAVERFIDAIEGAISRQTEVVGEP